MDLTYKIKDFLNYLLIDKKYSNNTIESYKKDLETFLEFFKKNNKEFTDINNKDIENYINFLKDKKLSEKSIARHISCLRGFYKYLILEKEIKHNPMDFVEMPKIRKSLPKVLSKEEVELLLNIELKENYDYRNKAMLELMYATGLRVSELINLKVHDIDLKMALLKTFGKGSKERIIPIGDYALAAIYEYLTYYRDSFLKEYNDYLFLNNHGKND